MPPLVIAFGSIFFRDLLLHFEQGTLIDLLQLITCHT